MSIFRLNKLWLIGLFVTVLLCMSLVVYLWWTDPHEQYQVKTPERMTTLSFSPDGTMIATGAPSGMIILWRAATGEQIRTLIGHTGAISDLAFRPDSTQLVSVSEDKTIRRWDVITGEPQPLPNSQILAMHPLQPLQSGSAYFQRVAWSEDSAWLAGGTNDGRVFLIDSTTGTILNIIQAYSATWPVPTFGDLVLNHAHHILVTSGLFADHRAKFWTIPSGTLLASSDDNGLTQAFYMIPDRGRLRLNADGSQVVRISKQVDVYETWDITGQKLTTIPSQIPIDKPPYGFLRPSIAVSYAISADAQLLATGGGILNFETLFFNEIDGRIVVWRIGQTKPVVTLRGHGATIVQAVAFSPDGHHLASVGWDNTLRLWDLGP